MTQTQRKLELKDLACYLPYGLKMQFESKGGRIIELTGITNQKALDVTITDGKGAMWLNGSHFFPLLRPLSALTLDSFEKHIGSEWCEAYGGWFDSFENHQITKESMILKAPYPVIEYCLENHIDIYSLIPVGLAISIED